MIVAANFKMNHTRSSTRAYVEGFATYLAGRSKPLDSLDLYLFPPFTALDSIPGPFRIGAQNGYPAHHGSFTGEIGLQQLREFGIETILLGHSERRHLLGEDQPFIAQKFAFYREHGFRIFHCIGETAQVRESNSKELIRAYLQAQLEGIDLEYEGLILAYEPVWAIGTGVSATVEEIAEVVDYLQGLTPAPIVYGGSVNEENVPSILAVEGCEGVLIGSASWDLDRFIAIVERIESV
ncbi:MAG: triose-phosphate isomerase [Nitratiruptor sp.]|nr:triose-phosphate isomerase [Nitratiruptor sp.]NPA83060.1 triose-phosphate isomerase [Campylobacterota bacterium]